MADAIDRRANKNKRDLTPAEKRYYAGIAKKNLEVAKAGASKQGKGASAVKKAMADKYIEQRGGGVTDRPGYDYAIGGSKAGDEYYLNRKPTKKK